MNAELLEHSIQGGFGTSHYQVTGSPFPSLFKAAAGNVDDFLEAARLDAVLLLKLTHTVEHIHSLNLRMQGEAELYIEFEGQRHSRYVNQEPYIIRVEGTCRLREK